MSEEIKVHVADYGAGRNLMLRYRDPMNGKQVAKSAKTRNPSKALKAAGEWEDQLKSGRYQKPSRLTWEAFRDRYATDVLPGLAVRTQLSYDSTLNVFEAKCNPTRLAELTTARVTAFVTMLRTAGAAEANIAKHLRQLKVAARWANRQGLLSVVPRFTMPKRVKGAKVMRGRPITGEEFDRMLAAVPRGIGARPNTNGVDTVTPWRFYLRGLWLSGLRLSESLPLSWTDAPGAIVVDMTGRRPMFRIPAEAEKGNRDRLLPMTPDFAEHLATVPEADRRGRVFKLLASDGGPRHAEFYVASKIVCAIGKAAGVVVDERTKGDKTLRKFASCHDLRRAFAARWSRKLHPNDLQQLMRHESMATTLAYYVGTDAEATADAIWAAAGNTGGNTQPQSTVARQKHSVK